MGIPSKIMWGKGHYLQVQHFQQQDQYHEARLRQAIETLQPYMWGVRHVAWDLAALKNNRLKPEILSLVFHDGDMYDAPGGGGSGGYPPGGEPLPLAVDLAALPSEVQQVTYYAALPGWTGGGGNVSASKGTDLARDKRRFFQQARNMADMLSDEVDTDVVYLKKAVLLVSNLEPLDGYDCFPLIRLRRGVAGGFEHDPAFIPPSLSVAAAPALQARLNQLMEALQAKADALKGHMREPSRNVIEFRASDVATFWLLHTVGTAAATLTHYVHHPAFHPERLFEALLGLAGALMTYSKEYALTDLPKYLHDDPGACFAALDGIIRALLDTVISAKCITIALEEKQPGYYVGKLDSGKLEQKVTLYLAVGADMPALQLVDVVPPRFKIGAPDDVEKSVMAALPGVKISHVPQVPAAIPVRPDTYYFALDARSALYEPMLKAQSICIYVPGGFNDLRLELLAVTA